MPGPENLFEELRRYPNVVGVSSKPKYKIVRGAVDRSRRCVRVYVERKVPESQLRPEEVIPKKVVVDGVEMCTDVVEIGRIVKVSALDPRLRYRPSPTGVSTGRLDDSSTGTIGWWVIDSSFNLYMVSNNHVWASENRGSRGDPVIQPGKLDGGSSTDIIGYLYDFVPILRVGLNRVDVAISTPISMNSVYMSILNRGGVTGARDPYEGETLTKYGRSTGVTTFKVIDDSATVTVEYSMGSVVFTDVVIGTGVGVVDGGDSGSPVISDDGSFTGLVFAGSDDGKTIVLCKQSNIVSELSQRTGRQVSVLVVNSYPPFFREIEYVYVPQQAGIDYAKVALQIAMLGVVLGTMAVPIRLARKD